MSTWTARVTPGVAAAGVMLAFNWWMQRPRTDVRMRRSGFTVPGLERLRRAKENSTDAEIHWQCMCD
jgi:hypothetical protein